MQRTLGGPGFSMTAGEISLPDAPHHTSMKKRSSVPTAPTRTGRRLLLATSALGALLSPPAFPLYLLAHRPPRGSRQKKKAKAKAKEHVFRHMLHLDEIVQCGGFTPGFRLGAPRRNCNGNADTRGFRLGAPRRNCNGNADASCLVSHGARFKSITISHDYRRTISYHDYRRTISYRIKYDSNQSRFRTITGGVKDYRMSHKNKNKIFCSMGDFFQYRMSGSLI